MRNRLSGISLRQQRVPQQLVRTRQVRSKFHRTLKRRDGGAVVAIFHVGLPEVYKSVGQLGRELGDLLVLLNRHIEMPLLIGFCAGLQMLQRFGGNGLPGQPQCQKNANHGFSGSTTSRNWSAGTSLIVWCAPDGQETSILAVFASPSPKWRRLSLEDS